MTAFLRALGYSPLYYWLLSAGSLLLLIAAAVAPVMPAHWRLHRRASPVVFGGLLLLTMIAWRWPAIFNFKVVNPDEPQFLAGAITSLAQGRFWWTEPNTSGPLVVLPLILPGLAGLPVDYGTGRMIALILEWGQVVLVYLTLRHVHGERWSRLLVLPLACLMVFLLFWDFVPYCSELAPLFLCALATWFGVTAFSAAGRMTSLGRLFASGLVLGILPFSKFQVLPLGAALGLALSIWTLLQPGVPDRTRMRDMLCLFSGTAVGLGGLLLSLWQSGLMAGVYQSYLVNNLNYAQARALPWTASGYILCYLSGFSWGFAVFHGGLLVLLLVSLRGLQHAAWRPLLLGWLLLLSAYVAVITPGRLYPHYLLFLSLPLALLVGLQFGHLLQPVSSDRARQVVCWSLLFFFLGVAPQIIDRGWDRHDLSRLVRPVAPWTGLVKFINQVKRPGDCLGTWGRRPELYVETQLPQATREACTYSQATESPLRDYYRARFLGDMHDNQPAFFIDSVGPDDFEHRDRPHDGHETFPALADYIRKEYVPLNQAGSIRLYVRRDLASQ